MHGAPPSLRQRLPGLHTDAARRRRGAPGRLAPVAAVLAPAPRLLAPRARRFGGPRHRLARRGGSERNRPPPVAGAIQYALRPWPHERKSCRQRGRCSRRAARPPGLRRAASTVAAGACRRPRTPWSPALRWWVPPVSRSALASVRRALEDAFTQRGIAALPQVRQELGTES